MQTQVAVIDYGSQYSQLIVRRARELGYFSKLFQPDELHQTGKPDVVILSGGPRSVSEAHAPEVDFNRLKNMQVPVLGVCYGMQLLNKKWGGEVASHHISEYGSANLIVKKADSLFKNIENPSQVWMSHTDTVTKLPKDCQILATNEENIPVALRWNELFFGIQFHPEVTHSHEGTKILQNFLSLSKQAPRFTIESFKDELIESTKKQVASRQVVCGVSGGVDSTVLAKLLHEAGVNLHCIFVNNGLLRKDEVAEVCRNFSIIGIHIDCVDASDQFLDALKNVPDPEEKRRRIGRLFLDVFFEHAGSIELFAQGTLYPDVIESATSGSCASVIKTHHNRVERVLELQAEGKVIEPLSELFKDEVRALGKSLGIPREILWRHPFPGPGLAVRVPSEVTRKKLAILREADAIFIDELKKSDWYDKIWQACAVLLPTRSVGVKGDERSYEYPVSLRAVVSQDAMTADWVEIPHDILRRISNRILNSVQGVNRVLYDISTKPPASIEWE